MKIFAFIFFAIVQCGLFAQIDEKEMNNLFDLGDKAYAAGDYASALKYYTNAGNGGHAIARRSVALMYGNGIGVEKNLLTALEWFKKAAEKNDNASEYYLAMMYSSGLGVVSDMSEAVRWLKLSAQHEWPEALNQLGVAYLDGVGVEKNLKEGVKQIHKAAELNYSQAQYNLAIINYDGIYIDRNIKEAIYWYEKAADNNNADAQYNLGVLYSDGIYVSKDMTKSVKYYKLAAQNNSTKAMTNLGIIYFLGNGVDKNIDESLRYLQTASDLGEKRAHEMLASVKSEKEKELEYFKHPFNGTTHEISEKDFAKAKKLIDESFPIQADISISISFTDFQPVDTRMKEVSPSEEKIKELKKAIEKNPEDMWLIISLGQMYGKLDKQKEMNQSYDEAERIGKKILVNKPDDSTAMYLLGWNYMGRGRYRESLEYIETYLKKYPNDEFAAFIEMMAFIGLGDMNDIYKKSLEMINRKPDSEYGYLMHGFYMVLTPFSNLSKQGVEWNFAGKTVDEIVDLQMEKEASEKYVNNYKLKLMYMVFRQMALIFKAISNPNYSSENYTAEEIDLKEMKIIEAYFFEILSKNNLPSKYPIYKYLTSLSMVNKDIKKVFDYGQKAINIKKTEPESQFSSSAEVRDLLVAMAMINQDTLKAEKIRIEKISAQNKYANAQDYVRLAQLQLRRNDFKATEKSLKKAIEINSELKSAWLGLSVLSIKKGEYSKAEEHLKKAGSPCDDENECNRANAILNFCLKKYNESYQYFQKMLEADDDNKTVSEFVKEMFK